MRELKFIWPLRHSNDFLFTATPREFSVDEVPLYEFSGEGEHMVLRVRKKELTTWEMLDIFSNALGIPKREIGYAGLKDKHAITTQYISMPKHISTKLEQFAHPNIKILEQHLHSSKIRVGHLKGNRFWVRLKRVQDLQKEKIESVLSWIQKNGIPNYFGMQRFGNSGKNYLEGKAIIESKLKIRDRKKREFLLSAYQSYLFNNWLAKRVELSLLLENFKPNEVAKLINLPKESLEEVAKQEHFFKLLEGDLYMHYPFGKIFYEELKIANERFLQKDISPTGLLCGKRVKLAQDIALEIENEYNYLINAMGSRRYAWIFPKITKQRYIPENAWYEIEFYLPKGSYATVLINFLKGQNSE